jgi:Outer membrane protein and related peptidoglycan-associated (lipo)proteins
VLQWTPAVVALDSDGDGVADYEDAEPFSPPGMTVDSRGVAQLPKYLTQPEIEDLIASKLRDYAASEGGGSVDGWFLPMIHFANDSYTIRSADYGHLKNIAEVLRANPKIRVAIQGFTDKRASETYNQVLSYNRARAAKEFLVNRYGVSADRLVLKYEGEDNVLVPTEGSSFMNRRVEFSVADPGATDMARPEGPNAGRGTFFSGSRDAGY